MIEKKFIEIKKNEYSIKEFIKSELGKGKISNVKIERTPIGERIILFTSRPGVIIGRKGESIQRLTEVLRKQFKMENPKIEIAEIEKVDFDAQTIADQIALSLERFGSSSFKIVTYKFLERIKRAGALGAEIILSGKLPGARAKTWRFSFGYLNKTGYPTNFVNSAKAVAETKPGTVGIKVYILPSDAKMLDRVEVK
jgi:small subunit ribosomal protein S3